MKYECILAGTSGVLMLCVLAPCLVDAHGYMTDPRQRGALNTRNEVVPPIDTNAPIDYSAHFPAGDKDRAPGAGLRSVRNAAGNFWTPYAPFDRAFHWRAGVCGDNKFGPQDHMRGGQYYYDAKRVRTYAQGSTINMEATVMAHHNGFFTFYICNIDSCGDEISARCFHEGHCQQLMRAPSVCDSGFDQECGPIDRNNPGRWYLPCRPPPAQFLLGGPNGKMRYRLPADITCDHCVIQWYWASSNTCNVAGVVEYFEGPDGPNWPACPGQGGAIGGYTKVQGPCGGEKFSEEYWQCADVQIVGSASTPPPVPTVPPVPTSNPEDIEVPDSDEQQGPDGAVSNEQDPEIPPPGTPMEPNTTQDIPPPPSEDPPTAEFQQQEQPVEQNPPTTDVQQQQQPAEQNSLPPPSAFGQEPPPQEFLDDGTPPPPTVEAAQEPPPQEIQQEEPPQSPPPPPAAPPAEENSSPAEEEATSDTEAPAPAFPSFTTGFSFFPSV